MNFRIQGMSEFRRALRRMTPGAVRTRRAEGKFQARQDHPTARIPRSPQLNSSLTTHP